MITITKSSFALSSLFDRHLPILAAHCLHLKLFWQYKIDEIPEHKPLVNDKPVSIDKIISCVSSYYKVSLHEIYTMKKRNGNKPRAIVIFLALTVCQYSLTQIASKLTNITIWGVSQASLRLRKKMREDINLRIEIENLKKSLFDMSNVQT